MVIALVQGIMSKQTYQIACVELVDEDVHCTLIYWELLKQNKIIRVESVFRREISVFYGEWFKDFYLLLPRSMRAGRGGGWRGLEEEEEEGPQLRDWELSEE